MLYCVFVLSTALPPAVPLTPFPVSAVLVNILVLLLSKLGSLLFLPPPVQITQI